MHNKRVSIKRTAVLCLVMTLLNLMLCGANISVELDTQSHIVYQSITADRILSDFAADSKAAKKKHNGSDYYLYGKVLSKKDNNKEISVGAIDSASAEKITCKFTDQNDISFVSGLSVGDTVRMYGKLSVGMKNALSIKAGLISKASSTSLADDAYSVKGGSAIKKSSMTKRTIDGSNISFYIPAEWKAVEHNIKGEKLGSMNGYQYRLNELGKKEAYAESFFVCCFDKLTGVDKNDRGDDKLIEEAILRDILGQDSLSKKFPLKTVKTYYGPKYKYYRDSYKKATGEKYQVEAVFQEDGDGIVMYLYVYKEPKNIDDIMVVMRLLGS